MDGFEFLLGIIIIVTIAALFRMRLKHDHRHGLAREQAKALREEVRGLRDRVVNLERIAIEKENSLEREIELLRDR